MFKGTTSNRGAMTLEALREDRRPHVLSSLRPFGEGARAFGLVGAVEGVEPGDEAADRFSAC